MTTIIGIGLLAAAQVTPPAASPPPPPAIQFHGPDGQPLPEDVERKLREQYKDALPAARPATASGDIVVNGRPPRGSVIGDIKPERTLSALDIRSYGTATVSELIQALGAQVSSGRNDTSADPIVLLNGRRVSSFAEIARLPTEAIERTEILPEEVALKYGYPADRKVVNVVAFERFTSRIVQGSLAGPTAGGQATTAGGASYLRIRGDTRTMLDADLSRSSALLESERDVRQPSGDPTLGDYRTLLPATHRVTLNATVAANPIADVAATLNGRVETSKTKALVGLGPDGVLHRDVDSATLHLGTTIGGRLRQWQWTATGNLDRTTNDSTTDTGVPVTPQNLARFATLTANADLLVNGSPSPCRPGPRRSACDQASRRATSAADPNWVRRRGSGRWSATPPASRPALTCRSQGPPRRHSRRSVRCRPTRPSPRKDCRTSARCGPWATAYTGRPCLGYRCSHRSATRDRPRRSNSSGRR